ncbi:hypothetical protein SAMN04515674_108192 [Pseudarcicella hirudinis]|uniref:Uncharacterized protein n=1 Tax=Pseudarcicella hirudinis TaxID=1079859 RepID=A0A1I5V4E5_9BACT|nr:hypothetical protein [Pseudarcicella hirudinis]SFQ02311.1 hypothetical protein SAMN04515674_108192 [Pseudarcicella hirudinis]
MLIPQFDDPPKPGEVGHNPNAIGAIETVVNGFRRELGLLERTSYFTPLSVVFFDYG